MIDYKIQKQYQSLLQTRLNDYENMVWLECGQKLLLTQDNSSQTVQEVLAVVDELKLMLNNVKELDEISGLLHKDKLDASDMFEVIKNYDKVSAFVINVALKNKHVLDNFVASHKFDEMPDTITEEIGNINQRRQELFAIAKQIKKANIQK